MFKKTVAALVSALSLGGCAQRAYTVQASFNPDSVAWAQTAGDDTLTGQAFLRTVGGDVKTCAGYPVVLVPYNSYFYEVTKAFAKGYSALTNKDPAAGSYARKSQCDARGDFSFSDLPTGEWIVVAEVRWGVPNGYFVTPQGGVLFALANTTPSGDTKVLLTK